MAKKNEAEGSGRITVGGDTVRMRFPSERQTKECRSIAVDGASYARQTDGSFIVSREHVHAMLNQGLAFSD